VVYSSKALAAELGVSNGPIREAMLALVDDGLMEAVPNKGFRAVPLAPADLADLAEIYEMRLLLEVPVVARLARRGLPGDRAARLTGLVNTIERTARSRDLAGNLAADRLPPDPAGGGGNSRLVAASPGCAIRPACTTCARLMPTGASSPRPRSTARCSPRSCAMTSTRPSACSKRVRRRLMGSLTDELQRREAVARAEAEELRGQIAQLTERLARVEERLSRLVIALPGSVPTAPRTRPGTLALRRPGPVPVRPDRNRAG
jgi:hypothetical protein